MDAQKKITAFRGATLRIPAPSYATWLRLAGGKVVTVQVMDSYATVEADATADMPDGRYATEWEVSTQPGLIGLMRGPELILLPSIKAGGVRTAPVSWARQALQAVEAALLEASSSGEVSIGADGVSFGYETRKELLEYRELLKSAVEIEEFPRQPGARFGGRRYG